MSKDTMTILVVGAGKTGVQVLHQLLKNPRLEILTLDPRDDPPPRFSRGCWRTSISKRH